MQRVGQARVRSDMAGSNVQPDPSVIPSAGAGNDVTDEQGRNHVIDPCQPNRSAIPVASIFGKSARIADPGPRTV